MQQKAEKSLFNLERERMKQAAQAENHFAAGKSTSGNEREQEKENIGGFQIEKGDKIKEEPKVVNLGVFGNSRKRPVGPNGEAGTEKDGKMEGKESLVPGEKKMKTEEA